MKVSSEQIERILKTLPVGYYLGQDILIEVKNDAYTSYFDKNECKIVISTRIIQEGLKNLTEEDDIETITRSMLYHEISHVILTPTTLSSFPSYFNVFEDERIETRLKDFYMRVNFKKTCKAICKDAYENAPKTFDEYWFKLVRFGQGKQQHIAGIRRLMNFYLHLNATSSYSISDRYFKDVEDYYETIKKEFEQQQQEQQSTQPSEQGEQNNVPTSNDQTDTSELKVDKAESETEDNSKSLEQTEVLRLTVKSIMQSIVDTSYDGNQYEQLQEILTSLNKKKGRYGGVIASYSGQFNYRQVERKDCKFFQQVNRMEHSSVISKIKLNLFIDGSSSYRDNVGETNKILNSLKKLEKQMPDFEFDLISVFFDDPKLQSKTQRVHRTYGCSMLGPKARGIFKSVQDKTARNINILLLDGKFDDIESSNFDVFNLRNCIIISDGTNRKGLEAHCKMATKTYLSSFNRTYSDNLFKAISEALRKQVTSL